MKKRFYKINIKIYNTLSGITRMTYLQETELLLNPLRYDLF